MQWLDQTEPRLEDALADPTVQAVMARDGVEPDEVWTLVRRLRRLRQHIRAPKKAA